jgi:prepilin-type N-terminal cleavage/methylation domain-containing protein/prepilin-type processing-associated H-X9-DG protein
MLMHQKAQRQNLCNKTSGDWVLCLGKTMAIRGQSAVSRSRAFTLIELLVVIAIIGILASILLPALVRAKQAAHKIKCISQLRQLAFALQMYADEHDGEYPPRRSSPNHWVFTLKPYYLDASENLLQCPSDRFFNKRSYLINGWNDYFEAVLSPADYLEYQNWNWPRGMSESAIPDSSETIIFGEKAKDSQHVHMDFHQGFGNDLEELDHKRHGRASNFAFADSSVRSLGYGKSINPLNLWAVTETWRNTPIDPDAD